MTALCWLIVQILWLVWAVVFWMVSTFFWLSVWVLLPVAVVVIVGVRAAEYFIGKERVGLSVKKHSLKFGRAAWHRTYREFFALGTLPLRVLGWLVFYTLWHSVISLFWTPGWRPWQRAWSRRWRRKRT